MRKRSHLQLAILHIHYRDTYLFLTQTDCRASEHFTQICANVSSRLCCGRPEGEVYSGTGMHNAREQRTVRPSEWMQGCCLSSLCRFRGHETTQGRADWRYACKRKTLVVAYKLFPTTERMPLVPVQHTTAKVSRVGA